MHSASTERTVHPDHLCRIATHVPAAQNETVLAYPEPCFRSNPDKRLTPDPADGAMLSYLCFRISAQPGDLLSHTRRILLACHLEDAEHTAGGLVDLFIATGAKGRALRESLLRRCAPVLGDARHAVLADHLDTGLSPNLLSHASRSVLTRGCLSARQAISRHS